MNTASSPSVITPKLVVQVVLIAAVIYIGVNAIKVPLLINPRNCIIAILIIGMSLCTPPIGLVAKRKQWMHPLAILGMLVGAWIILIGLAGIFHWTLFFINTGEKALLVMGALIAAKIVISLVHSALP